MKSSTWLLWCAAFFTATTLFLYSACPTKTAHFDNDSVWYDELAVHFTQYGIFNGSHDGQIPIHPIGYSVFLSALYSAFTQNPAAVVIAQWLLALLCGLILYSIARQLFNETVARIAALLFATNIGFLVYTQMVLVEIVLGSLLLSFIYFFLRYRLTGSAPSLMCAGTVLGLSILFKPVALFFIVPVCALLAIFVPGKLMHKLTAILIFSVSFYAPMLGYVGYNYVVYNVAQVTPLVNENLYCYFLPRVVAYVQGITLQDAQVAIFASDQIGSVQERVAIGEPIFWTYLHSNPAAFVIVWCNNVMRTFLGLYATQLKGMLEPTLCGGNCSFYKTQGTVLERIYGYICMGAQSVQIVRITLFEVIWSLIRYLLVAYAFVLLLRKRDYFLVCFFLVWIGYFAFITGHDGCGRYRLMFEPLLILLSAYVIGSIPSYIKAMVGRNILGVKLINKGA